MHPSLIRRTALAVAVVSASVAGLSAQGAPPLPKDSLDMGRRYAMFMIFGPTDSLLAHMSPAFAERIGGKAAIETQRAGVLSFAGMDPTVIEEQFAWRGGERQYWRTMESAAGGPPWRLRIQLSAQGVITGMGMGPVSGAPKADSAGPVIKKP